MLRQFFATLALGFSVAAMANPSLTVISAFPTGSQVDTLCRNVFEVYGRQKNVEINYKPMPGADQIVAHKALITSTEPALLCAGTPIAFNVVYQKDVSPKLDTLTPVTNVIRVTQFMITGAKSPDTLDALIQRAKQQNRPLMVGAPFSTTARVLTLGLDQAGVKYETVLYRRWQDTLPSLADGTLDVYIDVGTMIAMPQVKVIAHASVRNDVSASENIVKRWPAVANYLGHVIIFARNDGSDVTVLNRDLRRAITSEPLQDFYKKIMPHHAVVPSTPWQSSETMTRLITFLNAQQ